MYLKWCKIVIIMLQTKMSVQYRLLKIYISRPLLKEVITNIKYQ